MKKKLTDRAVKLLRPRGDRYEVWDTDYPGFGVRVSPAGRKSFVYLYRFEGRPRRMTLGVYHRVSLATARARYGKARELLDEKGRDPGAEQIDTKRSLAVTATVERACAFSPVGSRTGAVARRFILVCIRGFPARLG